MGTLRTVLDIVTTACFWVFLITWLVGAIYFGLKEPGGMRTLLRSLGRSWSVRIAIVVVIVGLRVLIASTQHAEFWAHVRYFWAHLRYWNPALALIGAALAVLATALLVWSRLVLGGMWASVPLVQDDHRLVTGGPYRFVRHPIYTGILGMSLAAALAYGFGIWILFPVLAVPFVLRRVYREDHMMADTFGEEYAAYRTRVPALFPRLTRGSGAPSPSAGSGSFPHRSG